MASPAPGQKKILNTAEVYVILIYKKHDNVKNTLHADVNCSCGSVRYYYYDIINKIK